MLSYFKGTRFNFTLNPPTTPTFSLSWIHYIQYGTGTSQFTIDVNSSTVVYSYINGDSGTITGLSSIDLITYTLYGSSINFNIADVTGTYGEQSAYNCALETVTANNYGFYLTANSSLTAVSSDDIFGCP